MLAMDWRVLSSIFVITFIKKSLGFSYDPSAADGPSNWGGVCNTGRRQSPVNIDTEASYPFNNAFPFKFTGYNRRAELMRYENVDKTLKVTIRRNQDGGLPPYVSEGGLSSLDNFEFGQLVFHWSNNTYHGSEHTINKKRYPLEAQLVHFNQDYGSGLNSSVYYVNEYVDYDLTDSLAIMSVFFDVQKKHNQKLWPLINALRKVRNENDLFEGGHKYTFALADLLPKNKDQFWRYDGSSTTPDCEEMVIWTVFRDTVGISKKQLKEFWKLTMGSTDATRTEIGYNYRSLQPLNGRRVTYFDLDQTNFKCDEGGLWKEDDYFYYRESLRRYSFLGAVHHCIGTNIGEDGDSVGLMPVGKLRHFKNRWAGNRNFLDDDMENHFCRARLFRVNAFKAPDGRWREYPGGSRSTQVLFHHYPEFNPTHGDIGDTLIWDSHTDRLMIVDNERDFHGLCFKDMERCDTCQGYDIGHECFDSGDCSSRSCNCDLDFTGSFCQHSPLTPYQLYTIGDSRDSHFDFGFGIWCFTPHGSAGQPPEPVDEASAYYFHTAYIFGDVHLCRFRYGDTAYCKYYTRTNGTWVDFSVPQPFILARYHAASRVIRSQGKDRFWMVAGGHEGESSYFNPMTTSVVMTGDRRWQRGPDLPWGVFDFCMVQISDCEIAILGGNLDADDAGTTFTDKTAIYNFETNTWREGPSMSVPRSRHRCAMVKDPKTHHPLVVVACGYSTDYTNANALGNVEIWDIVTNEVQVLDDTGSFGCPVTEYFAWAAELTDYQAVFAQGATVTEGTQQDHYEFWIFDLENGFVEGRRETGEGFESVDDRSVGGVAPRGYFDCVYP